MFTGTWPNSWTVSDSLTGPALLVAADSLTDPMNLGNLCRSAFAAGAHGIIIPKDRAAGVTPVVIKAAAGALEYLPVYRVTNLADCLGSLRDAGLAIIGAAADAPQSIYDTDLTQPLVLVIGSEDKGLRPRVRKQCDLVASIPMAAPEIGSLNAATSGAVALFEARRQRLMALNQPSLQPSRQKLRPDAGGWVEPLPHCPVAEPALTAGAIHKYPLFTRDNPPANFLLTGP